MGTPGGGSGGLGLVDWNTMIKPFVAYSVGSLSKLELMALMKAIVEIKPELVESVARSHPHALFYDVVTVLSAHVLTAAANTDLLQRSSFPAARQVARILCESLVARFHHILKTGHPILTVKTYINVIQEFHTGKLILEADEVSTMLALLKNQQLPPKIQSTAPSTWDKEGSLKESRRTRLDPSVLLYDQIALPILSTSFAEPMNIILAKEVVIIFERLNAGVKWIEACLSLPHLKALHPEGINISGEGIRSFYSKIISKYSSPNLESLEDEIHLVYRFLSMTLFGPLTSTEATELTQLGISVLYAVFVVIQHFYGGTVVPFTEEDYTRGVGIVSQAIWTEKRIAAILKNDTSLPQSTWLNFSFMMSKLTLFCIQSYMHHVTLAEAKNTGKDTGKVSGVSLSLSAVQGFWNELITAMAALAVSLIQNFVHIHTTSSQEQAIVAATGKETKEKEKRPGLSHFKIDQPMSSAERLRLFFKTDVAGTNSIELFIQLMTLSYRKACCLKQMKYSRPKRAGVPAVGMRPTEDRKSENMALLVPPPVAGVGGNGSRSSSITTSEGTHNHENEIDVEIDDNQSISDFMTTEDEDEEIGDSDEEIEVSERHRPSDEADEDSIFGRWFESLLVPRAADESSNIKKEIKEEQPARKLVKSTWDAVEGLVEEFIRDKSCPHGFIESALSTLSFLTRDIITNGIPQVQIAVKGGFNEQMMTLTGLVIKDLEKEKSMTEIGAIPSIFDDKLNHLFMDFSSEVGKLVQNLIAGEVLSPTLLSFFLDQLGIDLNGTGRWPMGLQSKSLAVLVQVLLLRSDKDIIVVQILKRVLDTLSISLSAKTPLLSYSDLSVEHAQTLVFLFHTLSLMQKKGVMIETATTLIKANDALDGLIAEDHQLLSLGRLLLLFDYFIRQLYEPDLRLVAQVQYNLFNQETTSSSCNGGSPRPEVMKISDSENFEPPNSKPLPPARLFSDCLEVIETDDTIDCHPIPFFYNLVTSEPNYQETPKLDGLSMNFLMNKSDGKDRVEYADILYALFGLMEAKIMDGRDGGGVHYLEYFLMRIFFSLPPPVEFLESLTNPIGPEDDKLLNRFPAVLYLLIWSPRLTHRHFSSWIRDTFSKQGLHTAETDNLIAKTIKMVYESKFLIKILSNALGWLKGRSQLGGQCPAIFYGVEAVFNCVRRNLIAPLPASPDSELILDDIKEKDGPSEKIEMELQSLLQDLLSQILTSLRLKSLERIPGHGKLGKETQDYIFHVMSIASEYLVNNSVGSILMQHLQPRYKEVMDGLKEVLPVTGTSFPPYCINVFSADVIPGESYIHAVVASHMRVQEMTSLKHTFGSLLTVYESVLGKFATEKGNGKIELRKSLGSLLLDKGGEFLGDMVGKLVNPEVYGKRDAPLNSQLTRILLSKTLQVVCDEKFEIILEAKTLDTFRVACFGALNELLKSTTKADVNEEILKSYLLEEGGLQILLNFLIKTKAEDVMIGGCDFLARLLSKIARLGGNDFMNVLANIDNIRDLPKHLFSRKFFDFEKVMSSVGNVFDGFLNLVISYEDSGHASLFNDFLLGTIETVKGNFDIGIEAEPKKWASLSIVLKILIKMAAVSDSKEGISGHCPLFRQMTSWFEAFIPNFDSYTSVKEEKLETPGPLVAMEIMLQYMLDVGRHIQTNYSGRSGSDFEKEGTPSNLTLDWDDFEITTDGMDDEDDESIEDSEDEGLNGKLCTYTITQKEFMTQHWYHCHSCGMTDRVGVCSICARVCHKGHDVTYSKFGSFFCDCGARADGECLALARRPSTTHEFPPPVVAGDLLPQPISVTPREPKQNSDLTGRDPPNDIKLSTANTEPIKLRLNDVTRANLQEAFRELSLKIPLETLEQVKKVVVRTSAEKTSIGAFLRVQEALRKLRKGKCGELEFRSSDELHVQTLGSPEGAFENMKMQYNGDQGAQIRQLINSQVIRRSIIAPISCPGAKRHFLAMSQDKGKITIFQLGALFGGGTDAGKSKKFSLQRLAQLTLPFTVLTMATNPIRDDVIAVCGLKDCQVIVMGTAGTIVSQLGVKAQLETQNHIIKPLWLPGSETELALSTSDGVKIFDLMKDTDQPSFHFLLPSGKVRDLTFVVQTECRWIVIMGNDGRIYSEKLDNSTSASHGPYYITNDLNYDDNEILQESTTGSNGEGKCVSVYYSHALGLLFYTYPNGKSYVGTLEDLSAPSPLSRGVLITPGLGRTQNLGLTGWCEVLGHPGLVFAMGGNSSAYILLLTGNGSYIQEIRTPTKSKTLDMVPVRHAPTIGKVKTSLMVLCDDGSLRVSNSSDMTDYWLNLRPQSEISRNGSRPGGNKLLGINKRMSKFSRIPGGQLLFPADFFEHSNPIDVEFGGNDLLQIYNPAQLKSRLDNPTMYIVSSKSIGFNLEVSSTDGSKVITGVRVSVGQHDVTRIPSFIQILGRTITVHPGRARWYDIPLMREESLATDQKLTLTFGPSNDIAAVTIVDSVKIYGKSKDAFAWPEDNEVGVGSETGTTAQDASVPEKYCEDSLLEKVIRCSLEMVEMSVRICPKDSTETERVLDLVTKIYLENYGPCNSSCRSLMATLLPNQIAFMDHRDRSLFSHSLYQIMALDAKPSQDVDPEQFTHLLMAIKNIALQRPNHISTYPYTDIGFGPMGIRRVVETLTNIFLLLVDVKPKNPYVVSLDRTGIQRITMVAWALAEMIYAVMSSDLSLVPILAPCLIFLLTRDPEISIPVKAVFVRRMRPKNVKKRRLTLPLESESGLPTPRPHSHAQRISEVSPPVEVDEPIVVLGGGGQGNNVGISPEMMNVLDGYGEEGEDGYPPVIDLQSDAEDEAMVELAIALSLQEQAGGAALAIQGIQQGLQALEDMHQEVLAQALNQPQEEDEEIEGPPLDASGVEVGIDAESDATASPPPSDDEVSTPPTATRNQHGGSESSGSSNGGGVSGRRRTRNPAGNIPHIEMNPGEDDSSAPHSSGFTDEKQSGSSRSFAFPSLPDTTTNKPFRIALLKALSTRVSTCNSALSLIPILQVVLQILSDLDGSTEEETKVVEELMLSLLQLINLKDVDRHDEWKRTEATEMCLVVLRMLSICVAKFRTSDVKSENMWIAKTTSATITAAGIAPFCKELLYVLRPTWKGGDEEEEKSGVGVLKTLKAAPISNAPDFHPFFLKQYVKSHASDLLEELPLLLSEMTLRIPYQIKKVIPVGNLFDSEWEQLLCEMLQSRHTPFVRRQARKLLLNIAGTRDGYHLLRDLYHVNFHLSAFQTLIGESKATAKTEFNYSTLVAMVEHLNTVIDIATQRPASWQTFCKSKPILQFLVEVSSRADESLTTAILTLLKIAVDGVNFDSKTESRFPKLTEEEKAQKSLAHVIMDSVEKRSFLEFVKKYLLEHGMVSSRWHAHALVLSLFLCSDSPHQLKLVSTLWELWPFVPAAGSRAAQFVDILGYATLKNDELKAGDLREHVHQLVNSIEEQGSGLLAHPNASIYAALVPFVSVDGYYLESEPCGVCYNVDRIYTAQKLATVKADARYTANHQCIKLTTTLNIVRLSLRLSEIKKARMIKSMGVYYSRKNISIVELKNHRSLWQLAKKVNLTPSQTEVKMDFSVPITAANLILEFSDFYENSSGTCETLQCPRCSASVPASPGVCSNCGENVFQCHKCRVINYDERDPFLCHSCGFCKYAKMDMSLLAKSIVAVDPIENEEDHKKAETSVSSLLEKADTTYKQTQSMKANLEMMLQSIKERRPMVGLSTIAFPSALGTQPVPQPQVYIPTTHSQLPASYASILAGAAGANNNVTLVNLTSGAQPPSGGQAPQAQNIPQPTVPATGTPPPSLRNVQSLAYGYAIDCKGSYEELNRLMSRVGAYRKEMLKLDPSAYPLDTMDNVTYRRCYGCMAASITQSLKLLQALITAGSPRDPFDLSFLGFLLRLSQAAGSTTLKEQIRNALCLFVKDDPTATSQLTDMIVSRVTRALDMESWSDLSFETSEEISLLASLVQMFDSCWEIKLRSLMKVFTSSLKRLRDPLGTETGLLPCLKIIQSFIKIPKQRSEKEMGSLSPVEDVRVNLEEWLKGNPDESFESWKKRVPKTIKGKKRKMDAEESRKFYLMMKYGRAWREKFLGLDVSSTRRLKLDHELGWMRKLLFCPGSIQTRTLTASLLKELAEIPPRRLKIMELLTHFLKYLPQYSESCHQYMELYRTLASPAEFSAFLNAKGALNIVCALLEGEIEKLHQRETMTLHSDLSQGVAVWELSKLLATLAIPSVCRLKRRSLLSTVLGGYLALKRLRFHRTRPVDEAQEILLSLLEDQVITKGTEEETKVFMSVCVEALRKCPKDDLITPVFVFERLCSLILHEESDVAEFYVTLDKDPQQEDFLQGRMLGNPYKSSDSGIGPLMRDIKNKVCTDCELVALLEDDNGMELLINNKIISLDLPVKEVYKRLWVPTNGQLEPMRIVYRMRGLLGDATEEFVESFAGPSDGTEDNETTYKLANVLVTSGGMEVVLKSLENVLGVPFVVSRGKPFIAVILKLLGYVVKVKNGRAAFLSPELTSVQTLLPILHLCLEHELTCISGSSGVVVLADQLLEILDAILSDGFELGLKSETAFSSFAKSRGSIQDIHKLLQLTDRMKGKPQTLGTLLKILGCLSFRDKEKMSLIFDYYGDSLNFFHFDEDSNPDSSLKLDQFCTLVTNIPIGPFGRSFKDLALERHVVEGCLDYIRHRAPVLEPPLGRPDADEWKEMVTKPALKYVLRILGGLAADHKPTQEVMSQLVQVIHQLEQVSSDEHVGSLAENALEALRSHEKIWKEVESARRATREEKKRLAMAMRTRQLNAIGMKTNEKGQVMAAASSLLDQMEELGEETGLVCVICREGYKFQPTKALGIYTFTKRVILDETESTKGRKTYAYSTVSHFNVVHVDCHMAAIRLARGRDEWESASLQNGNTRCNGLIPLWGPQVPESSFAASLARHNSYLQEATAHRDVGFSSGVQDIKSLLIRFAEEKSFHEDTGGGGPESNMHLIPYLFHTTLYVLNTTRLAQKESSTLDKFLGQSPNIWKEDLGALEGPFYQLVVSLMVFSHAKWKESRLLWLKRVLTLGGKRSKRLGTAEFSHYRPGLIYFGLIGGLYSIVFKDVSGTGEWPSILADYIRRHDEGLLKSTNELLGLYQKSLLPASSLEEMFDVLGVAEEVGDIPKFLDALWTQPAETLHHHPLSLH